MKNKKYITTISALGAVALPLSAVISCAQSSKRGSSSNFKISYHGSIFNSKESLIRYIKDNSLVKTIHGGETHFKIKGDKTNEIFTNKQEAVGKIYKNYIQPLDVYVNYGTKFSDVVDPMTGEIARENFVTKKESSIYTAFKVNAVTKYEVIDEDGKIIHKTGSKYIFAKSPTNISMETKDPELKAEREKIDRQWKATRDKAASTFMQIHNAYLFNGKYYENQATLGQALKGINDKGDGGYVMNIFGDSFKSGEYKGITTGNGASYQFSPDVLNDDSSLRKKIKGEILRNVHKVFTINNAKKSSNLDDGIIDINHNNEGEISNYLAINHETNAIEVMNNGDIPTFIVDMNKIDRNGKRTPANFIGDYYIKAPMGATGIVERKDNGELVNWHRTSEQSNSSGQEDLSIREFKSILNYLLISSGINSPLELFNKILVTDNGKKVSFIKYLESMNIWGQTNSEVNYYNLLKSFIKNLANGVNYNFLDTLNASYSYIIDKMIGNKEKNEDIFKVAKGFQSTLELLDTIAYKMISPFLLKDDQGFITERLSSNGVKLNYFASAMSFYGESKKNHGIDFQRDPKSIYRHLLGRNQAMTTEINKKMDKTNDENSRNLLVFSLLRSAMGLEGIKLKGIKHNEQIYNAWLKGKEAIDLSRDWKSFEQDENDKHLVDYKFVGQDISNVDSKEYQSIWEHIQNKEKDLPEMIKIGDFSYSLLRIRDNFDTYVKNENEKFITVKKAIIDVIKKVQNDVYEKGLEINEPFVINKIIKDYSEKYNTKLDVNVDKDYKTIEKFLDIENAKKSWKDFWSQNYASDIKKNYLPNNSYGHATPLILAGEIPDLVNSSGQIVSSGEYMSHLTLFNNNIETPIRDRIKNMATFVGTKIAQVLIAYVNASSNLAKNTEQFKKVLANPSANRDMVMEALKNISDSNKKFKGEIKSLLKDTGKSSIDELDFSTRSWNDNDYRVKDMFNQLLPSQIAAMNFKNKLDDKNYNWSLQDFSSTTLDFLGISSDSWARDVASVSMDIATNVIPFVKNVFGFINSFNKSEKIYYEYNDESSGHHYIWDGVSLESSWWGMSQKQVGNIKDLNLIDSKFSLLSGRGAINSGYYYNSTFYQSTKGIAAKETKELIDYVMSISCINHSGSTIGGKYQNYDLDWSIDIKTGDNSKNGGIKKINADSVEELVDKLIQIIKSKDNKLSPSLYNIGGELVLSSIDAKDKWATDILTKLKPVTVFQMPEYNKVTGLPVRFNDFSLNYLENPDNVDKFLIFNPNRNKDNSVVETKQSRIIDDVNKKLSNLQGLSTLAHSFAENIPVDSKDVLFSQIIGDKKEDFDLLDGKNTESVHTIYSAKQVNGTVKYFKSIAESLKHLISEKNYELVSSSVNNDYTVYQFDEKTFSTYKEIYDYIMNRKEGDDE